MQVPLKFSERETRKAQQRERVSFVEERWWPEPVQQWYQQRGCLRLWRLPGQLPRWDQLAHLPRELLLQWRVPEQLRE